MNIRDSRTVFLATTIRLVLVGLVLAGCTTMQTERVSTDQGLHSRRVRGPSGEIFNLALHCVYREFPNASIRTDPRAGEIVATDYSIVGGDIVVKVTVIGWPDDQVEVNISANGLGTIKKRADIDRFLDDFDQAYVDWSHQHVE